MALYAEALLGVTKLVQCRDEMFNAYVVMGHHRPDIHKQQFIYTLQHMMTTLLITTAERVSKFVERIAQKAVMRYAHK